MRGVAILQSAAGVATVPRRESSTIAGTTVIAVVDGFIDQIRSVRLEPKDVFEYNPRLNGRT